MAQQVIGRYRILGELGRGATGIVYRAVDPLIEREVAIKTLSLSVQAESPADTRARFLREAKSAGRLNHPNIVTIHDVGEDQGVAYIAMELLDGRTLLELMREAPRLPAATAVELIAQVADALEHAHRLSIVHRDVKPGNIMVSAGGHAKLTDFGIAFVTSSSMTHTGVVIGSPRYMSPEQVRGLRVDARSDVFSLGIVLYELLTGEPPFDSGGESSVFAVMDCIVRKPYRPARAVDPEIPEEFEPILARALAKEPAQRYRNVADMARDLRALLPILRERSDRVQSDGAKPASKAMPVTSGNAMPGDKTVVVREDADVSNARAQLLQDLDAFSREYERARLAMQRVEEANRRRRQEALERWGEEQARQWLVSPREAAVPAADGAVEATGKEVTGTGRRSALRERLRRQASAQPVQDWEARREEQFTRIDRRMRLLYEDLNEYSAEANAVSPVFARPYAMSYFGDLVGLVVRRVAADYRTIRHWDKDVCNHVSFRFQLIPSSAANVSLMGHELQRFRERLDGSQVAYRLGEEKNEFGHTVRAKATLDAVPCGLLLRADYDAASVAIQLRNLGRFGNATLNLSLEEFADEVFDALVQYAFGLDDAFEARLRG